MGPPYVWQCSCAWWCQNVSDAWKCTSKYLRVRLSELCIPLCNLFWIRPACSNRLLVPKCNATLESAHRWYLGVLCKGRHTDFPSQKARMDQREWSCCKQTSQKARIHLSVFLVQRTVVTCEASPLTRNKARNGSRRKVSIVAILDGKVADLLVLFCFCEF